MIHSLYLKVFGVGLQDTFVYRWNFVLRSLFGIAPLFATVLVWKAVCEANGAVLDYSFATMVFYFVGVLIVENLASPTEDEWRIAAEIRDGHISALLLKPINYLLYRLTLFVSYRFLYTLITLPVLGLILWLLREHLRWPTHPSTWLLFLLAVTGSALMQFLLAYSLAMLAFWFLEVSTLIFFLYSFEYFLSGHVFPLDLLPKTVQSVLQWAPFPYELYFPVQVLLERLSTSELLRGFSMQILCIFLMATLAHLLWKHGVRRYQAFGG
jgi:ABC-2 type transport system permease protein